VKCAFYRPRSITILGAYQQQYCYLECFK